MWLSVAFIGYACLAVVSILDKFILSKEKILPSVFVFYSTIFLLPLNFAVFFLSARPSIYVSGVIILSAAAFSFGLWTMYRAFEKSEVSHMGPFIGGLIPLFILVLGQIFLPEFITTKQVIGILLLSFGTITISIQKNMGRYWKNSIIWALVAAVSFSISHISSKYVYSAVGFGAGFTYIWGAMGFVGLALLFTKNVQSAVFPHRNIIISLKNKISFQHNKSKHQVVVVASDKVLSAVGSLSIQYAVSLGSVTKVYALSGAQYAFLILLVFILSRFFPKIFREKYDDGEVYRELIAVIIIAVGLAFLV
ncbi:MAG: hypothetical protein WC725_00080 [Patescibacteria group bacterium]|jgi:drug/metabolite transporter (DMT)-like permease